ncbi:MarR family winged helix-turn-helix transcriptional regulator [Oryzicola mucosus]|uniref:MarR family transcriptional regulator n=1 Tax=Oryzicola mucosus TaxID=2767425 RepID=A0A8J6PIT6_9HYPH|nr:MarR family transcriptional regulator [Oryzicola mucosus]MBD0415699.1 MarR family transcriptional regulator [Oryzicola mucosus]
MDSLTVKTVFVEELLKANRKLQAIFEAKAKEQGLTFSRARMLIYLAHHEGVTQSELATVFEIEQPSVVGLIDALEKKGFVERRSVAGDRRAKGIVLTDVARAEAKKMFLFLDQARVQMLDGIKDDEIQVAASVILRLSMNIESGMLHMM